MIHIKNLKETENPIAKTLLAILENTLPLVEDSFYESTIYGSKADYNKNVFQVKQAFMSNFGKQLVNTPLTFVRDNNGAVWSATAGQGIVTGVMLFHYVTKQPLFLATIDKDADGYKYESAKYNEKTKTFDSLTSKNKAAASIKELSDFLKDSVGKDIATFITQQR
jgi:hypothetical protein